VAIEWAALSALGTIAAAVIPGWAYFRERRDRRSAEAEARALRNERDLKELRDQREKIADEVRRLRLYSNANVMGRTATSIRIVNDSAHPVHLVFVGLELSRKTPHHDRESVCFMPFSLVPHELEPGQEALVESSNTDVSAVPWLCFYDLRGRIWSRDLMGRVRTWYPPGFENESSGELFSSGMGRELPLSEEAEMKLRRMDGGGGLFT